MQAAIVDQIVGIFFPDFIFNRAGEGAVGPVGPQGIVVQSGVGFDVSRFGVFIDIFLDSAALEVFQALDKSQFLAVYAFGVIDVSG